MSSIDSLRERYTQKMKNELDEGSISKTSTSDYNLFRETLQPPTLSFYEKACQYSEDLIPVSPDDEKIPEIQKALKTGHVNATPTGTMSFALMLTLTIILVTFIFGFFLPMLFGNEGSLFVVFFGVLLGAGFFLPATNIPFMIADSWRMRASNQMVMSVFYVVTFMRHTPNLELAIEFAGEHLGPPLNLDFRKVLWDVETGQYSTITESLDEYLEQWREHNPEFIEAMHLIESSVYESSESRRADALDKSLDVILDETYEKMLHFSHGLKEPINMLNMLGIVLPVLGLIILPMITSFMEGARWYHIMMVYNIFLPVVVYYMGRRILASRPTGYGGVDVNSIEADEDEDEGTISLKVGKDKPSKPMFTPYSLGFLTLGVCLFIGLLPLTLYYVTPTGFDIYYGQEGQIGPATAFDPGERPLAKLLDYKEDGSGPFGLGSTLLSMFIPVGIGLCIGIINKLRSDKFMKIRKETSELESEFSSALFQLGNRLGDGVPAEIAFSSVARVMQDTRSGEFFDYVSSNIARQGMSVNDAIFDSKQGAIRKFPSTIIESSMKVFIQSVKKGPMVASQALLGVARYIKGMHKVDERLQDLLAEVLGGMKTQAKMLTPGISGVVVGITSLITQLLGALGDNFADFEDGGANIGGGILEMLGGGGVPSFYFQAVVGIYVIQISYILSIMINGIENGSDETYQMHLVGTNLITATITYAVVALGFTIGFSFISFGVIENIQ